MDYSKRTSTKIIQTVVLLALVIATGFTQSSTAVSQPVTIIATVPGVQVVAPPSGGGGGGGGGGGSSSSGTEQQGVIFRGIAYPGSIVTLFKNGVIVAEQPTSPDATFEIIINGLRTGTYLFSLRGQDNEGRQSALNTYTIFVTAGITTIVKGIFIAPTVSLDKKEVRRGDTLTVLGKSTQNAEVTLIFNSETQLIKKTTVDPSGAWFYKLDTLELEYGDHQVKARTALNTDMTSFSQSLAFKIGTQSIVNDLIVSFSIYDLNKDGRVNLVDFSILVYWYRRTDPPKTVDFNGDLKVNLIDFSLLIYHWTG